MLIAIDGSPSAQAALMTASVFLWPRDTRVQGVVACPPEGIGGRPEYVRMAVARSFERVAASARRRLARHWPDADIILVKEPPVEGILRQAERFSANVIVLGWRGHGSFRRLLMGSVSRSVVERARTPVLVVRRRTKQIRRAVIGVDGSPNARRAVELATRFHGDRMRTITVARVIEPVAVATAGLLPASVRATVLHNAAMLNKDLVRRARREVESAATRLKRAGWKVRTDVRWGAPLAELLDIVKGSECDLLVVGARGVRGLTRALLGSVAAGALNRSPVPVLVVH